MIEKPSVTLGRQQYVRDVVVLAEGKDEAALVEHLLEQLESSAPGIRDAVQVVDCQGVDKLPGQVRAVITSNLFQGRGGTLGIVTDEDTLSRAVAGIDLVLAEHGRTALPAPGEVHAVAQRRTGLFASPGLGRAGAVEVLYLEATDPLRRTLAEEYVTHVEAATAAVRHRAKAELQAVLAALPKSPRQAADALQRGQGLVVHEPAFDPLVTFLQELTRR